MRDVVKWMSDVLGWVYWLPPAIWQAAVLTPRCVWIAKHRGRGADLSDARLHFVSLSGACLAEANLGRANILQADLESADLTQANLSCSIIHGSNLHQATLRQANLRRACLVETNLKSADLTEADLTNALFLPPYSMIRPPSDAEETASLVGVDLTGATLTGANLRGANLMAANFTDTILTGAHYDAVTRWPNGFDPVRHGLILVH
jgi:uncharacterized protein YjbI with pentapeptide repeats